MKDSATPAKTDGHAPHSAERFPIVGIGASAGGLEALEDFFSHTPADSGMAFVVVQHLDPTHKGMMPELLQRVTSMPVTQVRDRMKVKRDCIYVIPPNKDLSLLHGVLHLIDPVAPRGLRLPIDFFLRSLADDQHERAIAVIAQQCGDPRLNPSRVAHEVQSSLRQLQLVFSEPGNSVAGEIRRQRARLAHSLLVDSRYDVLSIDQIAQRAGFNSPMSLRRALDEAYETTPRALRAARRA